MGKISILTQNQRKILDKITQNKYIRENFYLTGGTALAEYYLKHRYSEDLDLFTEKKYETENISIFIKDTAKALNASIETELIEYLYRFQLKFPKGEILKIDFSYYPGNRVEKGKLKDGLQIDSLRDIAVNKLSTIVQRYNVKDYVDLFYLLKEYTIWDLVYGVKAKFNMEMEPWIFASDVLYTVEKFDSMPKMIKPLTLPELKKFFRKKALEWGKTAVKK